MCVYFLFGQILSQHLRIALMRVFLEMYFLLRQFLHQQVRIHLMWVFSRYVPSIDALFTTISAYCFNVDLCFLDMFFLLRQILPHLVRIALIWTRVSV